MNRSNLRVWRRFVCASVLCALGCGSRSQLGDAPPLEQSCQLDSDCAPPDACGASSCQNQQCVRVDIDCSDGDECTEDRCDSHAGCVHRAYTIDADGDGHNRPRAGFAIGSPGACGDDCNDLSAAAFPGNREICDLVDNDCDGIVDDNFGYQASSNGSIRVSSADDEVATGSSLAAVGETFVAAYDGLRNQRALSLLVGLDPAGKSLFRTPVSEINAQTYSGSLAWSGQELWTAWSDSRDSSYDIYFGRFNPMGDKLAPSARVTDAPGFSLNPDIQWNVSQFVMAWDDRRGEDTVVGDFSRIFGQRVDGQGRAIGKNVPLVANDPVAEEPSLAVGTTSLGLTYTSDRESVTSDPRAGFRTYTTELVQIGRADLFGTHVQSPKAFALLDRYAVVWTEYVQGVGPGQELMGATFDQQAKPLLLPRALRQGAPIRNANAVSLGDRLLVAWSEFLDGNFELFWQLFDRDLQMSGSPQRLTNTRGNSVGPSLAIGPSSRIGVLYSDDTGFANGNFQTFFTTLECRPPNLQ